VALHPSYPAEAVQTEGRLILSQIQARSDTPFQFTFDTMLEDLYDGHPYALPLIGRRGSIERLSREDLMAHYRNVYKPNRLVLAVSGHVPSIRVLSAVEKLFGTLPASPGADAVPMSHEPFTAPAPPVIPAG